jgi:hypothetical protein
MAPQWRNAVAIWHNAACQTATTGQFLSSVNLMASNMRQNRRLKFIRHYGRILSSQAVFHQHRGQSDVVAL